MALTLNQHRKGITQTLIATFSDEGESTIEANGTKNINICTKGTIDGTALSLPEGVTLETAVGNKTLSDVLEGLGFHIDTSTIENTKIEN